MEGQEHEFSVFLDLSKAFDYFDFHLLFNKIEVYGITGLSHVWLKSYMTNREQVVYVGNVLCDPISLNYGVPQGSNLDPVIFTLYINDLHFIVSRSVGLFQYDDDTAISLKGHRLRDVENNAFILVNTARPNAYFLV